MAERGKKPQQFYVINPTKSGGGDEHIVMVSPTQQDVARAKSEMKYERKQEDTSDHIVSRSRKSNIKKIKHNVISK